MKFFIVDNSHGQLLKYVVENNTTLKNLLKLRYKPNMLVSFINLASSNQEKVKWYVNQLRKQTNIFLIDSGAFTFMNSPHKAKKTSLDGFVEQYAKFLRDNDIEYFFEMDVDSVTGYEKVLEYREFIEKVTKRKSIPVWHKNRGIDEYTKMLKHYKVVAIGGIVIKELEVPKDIPMMNSLTNLAHEKNIWVHGLGIGIKTLRYKFFFDSVDAFFFELFRRFRNTWVFDANKKLKQRKIKNVEIVDKEKLSQFDLEILSKIVNQLMKLDKNPNLTKLVRR